MTRKPRDIAHYVVGGRCPTCGHVGNLWPPAAIIEAAQRWEEKHGKPPRAAQWSAGTPEHPAKTTVVQVFGRWNTMIAAAGFNVYHKGQREYWTRDEMAAVMLDHLLREGRWPGYRQWQVTRKDGEDRPSASSVVRKFGSWDAAKRYAGFTVTASKAGTGAMVDSAPVLAALRDYLGPDGTATALADRMGVDSAPFLRLLKGDRKRIAHGAADELLTAISRPDVMAILEAA